MAQLPRYDAAHAERLEAARARGKVLRYVGKLTADGRATVGWRSSMPGMRSPTSRSPTTSCASPRAATATTRSSCRVRARVPRSPRAACSPTCCAWRRTWGRACECRRTRTGRRRSRRLRSVTSPSDSTSWVSRWMRSATASPSRAAPSRAWTSRRARGRRRAAAGGRDNTAGRALLAMQEACDRASASRGDRQGHSAGLGARRLGGLRGGRGRGGQCAAAASLHKLELLQFAMQGEAVASGSLHVDNIAPSLFGGLVLTVGIDHPRVKQIPVPAGIRAVIVHPHMFLSTNRRAPSSSAPWSCRISSGRRRTSPASFPAATRTIST